MRGAFIVTTNITRLAFLSVFALNTEAAEHKADFFVADRVQHLVVYNEYQQRAATNDLAGIVPFAPFVIVDEDDVLGDGFTRCMKVETGGRIFFLEKDSSGNLSRSNALGFESTFRKATVLNDTIEVLKENRLERADVVGKGRTALQPGVRVIRVFAYRGRVYVKTIGVVEQYGWVNFSGQTRGVDWDFVKVAEISVAEQLQRVLPQIRAKALDINTKLTKLYDVFSRKSLRTLAAPQWQVNDSSLAIVCSLQPDSIGGQYAQSTRQLSKNIEGFLLGTRLKMTTTPGRIEIR